MDMLTNALLGAAHAFILGVFLIAAAGKLAACKPGMRVMCMKGSLDAALVLLACLVALPGAGVASALAAVLVGAGGWLRERIRRNTVCNCFGVLTPLLHPWRNGMRAILVGTGSLALLLSPHLQPAAPALWIGAALGLSVLLASMGWVFARSVLARQPAKPFVLKQVATLEDGAISPDSVVGIGADGRTLRLRDLLVPGQPLPILMTSPSCAPCQALKSRLEPLLPGLAVQLHIVSEGAPSSPATATAISDPDGQWRKTLGVKSMPSLVIVNGSATNLDCPVIFSPETMFFELLRLQAEGGAAPLASGAAHAMQAA